MSYIDIFKHLIKEGKTPKEQLLDMLEEINKRNEVMLPIANNNEYVINENEYSQIKEMITNLEEE